MPGRKTFKENVIWLMGAEEPMDVIVLCASHHAQFHGKGGGE